MPSRFGRICEFSHKREELGRFDEQKGRCFLGRKGLGVQAAREAGPAMEGEAWKAGREVWPRPASAQTSPTVLINGNRQAARDSLPNYILPSILGDKQSDADNSNTNSYFCSDHCYYTTIDILQ
jgi:hypothetical protein